MQCVIWGAKAVVVEEMEAMEMGHLCCKARDKGCRDGVFKAKGEERGVVSDGIFAWSDPASCVLEFPATCSLIGLKSAF